MAGLACSAGVTDHVLLDLACLARFFLIGDGFSCVVLLNVRSSESVMTPILAEFGEGWWANSRVTP